MRRIFIFTIAVFLLFTVISIGYYFFSTKNKLNDITTNNETTLNSEPISVPSFDNLPEVKYQPLESFSQTDIQQLNGKYVFPIIEYYSDKPAEKIKSITFGQNENDNSNVEYPFIVSISFVNGAKADTLITKTSETIDWWYPECLNGCSYSESFKRMYPEIVTVSQ